MCNVIMALVFYVIDTNLALNQPTFASSSAAFGDTSVAVNGDT